MLNRLIRAIYNTEKQMNKKLNQPRCLNSEKDIIQKLYDYIKISECAAIYLPEKWIADPHKTDFGFSAHQDGQKLLKNESQADTVLKAKLLYLGYGITHLNEEKNQNQCISRAKENCYFVVNLSDDPNFYDNLFNLSEFFNRNFFLYKPHGTLSGQLIVTNQTATGKLFHRNPEYHQTMKSGLFHPDGFDETLSEMRNKMIRYNLNKNKNQDIDFIRRDILSEETFKKLSIVSKAACARSAAKVTLDNISSYEDYSNTIRPVKISNPKLLGEAFEYVDCKNVCLILEQSLNRIMFVITDKDFAIMSAFSRTISKQENVRRNRVLRHQLTLINSGIYQLVGHWVKAYLEKAQGGSYSGVIDNTERLYLIIRRNNISAEEFKNSVQNALTVSGDSANTAIIKNTAGIFILNFNGELKKISNDVSLYMITQAYSKHSERRNEIFIFDGVETPVTNLGRQIYSMHHILY